MTWAMDFCRETSKRIEPLMGWVASDETVDQVRLKFPTAKQAIAFAEQKGYKWTLDKPIATAIKPKNYSDNFRYKKIIS